MVILEQINMADQTFSCVLNKEINLVKIEIKNQARPKFAEIRKIIEEVIDLNGKMLRPLLMILSGHFGHYSSEKTIKLAASLEMLHMATLIHDDIIDDAVLRRNQLTVQSRYGKDLAVYAGDYLLSKSMRMLDPEKHAGEQISKLASGIEKICESELLQYQNRYKVMSVKDYLRVVSGKTAALFAIAMYVGAKENQCDEKLSKNLGRVGYELGIAFQIIDDILDFSNDQEKVGKSIHNDIKKGYYTLPVIYALQGKSMDENLEAEDLHRLVNDYDGLTKSRILAKKYTEKAFRRVEKLPEGEAKNAVKAILEQLLKRDY